MFKPLAIFIGLRYTRAKRRNHFISFITLMSLLGIAIGVTALITVLSVMNGFEAELKERILGMTAQATVSGFDGTLSDWKTLEQKVREQPHVRAVAPFVEGEVMLTEGPYVRGALVQGIEPAQETDVDKIAQYMKWGSLHALKPGSWGIVLGVELARALGVQVGDKVTLVAPETTVTPAGVLPRLRRFTVVGIFDVGYSQYDSSLALVNLTDAAKLFRMGEKISGLRLRFDNLFAAPEIAHRISRDLGGRYWVRDWTQNNANFFRALRTEKTVMFIILALIVGVAAFNIVSTLIMVVTDKRADIAILRTLGATPRSIMGIFMVQGSVIGVLGTILGGLCGVALAENVETIVPFIERVFHTKFLSPQVYYISEVPSQLHWHDVGVITVLSLLLSLLATIYPAWRASRVQPAESLRYE